MAGRNTVCVWLLPVWFIINVEAVRAQESEALSLKNAEQHWQQYVEKVSMIHIKVVGRYRHIDNNNNSVFFDNAFQLSVCGEYALTTGDSDGGKSRFVRATNDKYRFEARATDSEEWRRERLDVPLEKKSSFSMDISPDDPVISRRGVFSSDAHGSVVKALCGGLMLWDTWFPAMVHSADFAVVTMDRVSQDGRELIKLQFTYNPSNWRGNIPRDGWVMLDPKQYWLIVQGQLKGEWGHGEEMERAFLNINNSLSVSESGIPLLVHQDVMVRAPEDGSRIDDLWTREYNYFEADCNPAHYMLSAYNLAEPELGGRIAWRWQLFLIGNLLILVAVAVYVGFLWRRRASTR